MIELLSATDPDPHVVKIKAALRKVAIQSSLGPDKGPLHYPYSTHGPASAVAHDLMIAGRGDVFTNPRSGYLGVWLISPATTPAGCAVMVFDDPDNVRVVRAVSVQDGVLTYEWGDRRRKSWVWVETHERVQVDTPDTMPTVADASLMVVEQASLIERMGQWLSTEATEEDWCDQFERECEAVGLSVSRAGRLVEVRMTLTYQIRATDLDSILSKEFGGDHDVFDSVDVESRVTLSGIPLRDAEQSEMSEHLSEAGYSGWDTYEVDEWEEE
jgi:hypothetical protein